MTDNSNSKFPSEAEVVIVGVGGIVGSMLAYWLAELGQKNIVGLEKSIFSRRNAANINSPTIITSFTSLLTMDSFRLF